MGVLDEMMVEHGDAKEIGDCGCPACIFESTVRTMLIHATTAVALQKQSPEVACTVVAGRLSRQLGAYLAAATKTVDIPIQAVFDEITTQRDHSLAQLRQWGAPHGHA